MGTKLWISPWISGGRGDPVRYRTGRTLRCVAKPTPQFALSRILVALLMAATALGCGNSDDAGDATEPVEDSSQPADSVTADQADSTTSIPATEADAQASDLDQTTSPSGIDPVGAVRVTDDSGRLSVEIPADWSWDGAATSASGGPFIGASSGPPGSNLLDSPVLQLFVAPTDRTLPDLLGVLLDTFGFEAGCIPAPEHEAYDVGTISGLRALGEDCGPNGFATAAFIGNVDPSTGEIVVFAVTTEPDSVVSPEMILESLEVN